MINNKKAAMEMSVGTIVTIVLLMSVLVLGLILISNIFASSTDSVGEIDEKVKSQINEVFAKQGLKLAFSPSDRKITLKKETMNRGFAFSVNNKANEDKTFTYEILIDAKYDIEKNCMIGLNEAEDWLLEPQGTLDIPKASSMELPQLVLFNIPAVAPKCTIPYTVKVFDGNDLYSSSKVYVTIE